MLVHVALMILGMFAVLSLVIDMGAVRLTQNEMQTAADTASLEAVRQRNVSPDGFASDCTRRLYARELVRSTFDDPGGEIQFGAGPLLELTGGEGNLNALQTVSVPDVHAYKPDLQLNQSENLPHGDLVSGRFTYTASSEPDEDNQYIRTTGDFVPSGSTPAPSVGYAACPADAPPVVDPTRNDQIGVASTADSAFLVRLRRTNDFQGLDSVDGVSSSGPALPFLFGRATVMMGADPNEGYSPRHHGVTVRATAIAQVRPALRAGLPGAVASTGVLPFALVDTFVTTVTEAGTQATIDPATGSICPRGIACAPDEASETGRYVDALAPPAMSNWKRIDTVGKVLPAPVPIVCSPSTNTFSGYGPVYGVTNPVTGAKRIIGFSRIAMGPDPAGGGECAVVISRGVSLVASSNATAVLSEALPVPADITPAELRCVLHKNRPSSPLGPGEVCPTSDYAAVLAPVMAR